MLGSQDAAWQALTLDISCKDKAALGIITYIASTLDLGELPCS
jgi:hypothetical protein